MTDTTAEPWLEKSPVTIGYAWCWGSHQTLGIYEKIAPPHNAFPTCPSKNALSTFAPAAMSPPPKTYRSELEAAIRAAEKAGINLKVVPATLRPQSATIPYLRDLAKAQEQPCAPCVKKGIICQVTNLSRVGCFGCMWGRDCTWQICMTILM